MLGRRRLGRISLGVALLGAALLTLTACAGGSVFPQADGAHPAAIATNVPNPATTTQPAPDPVSLTTTAPRQSGGVIASAGPTAPYNYAPTVLFSRGQYRMWWCSQLPGALRPGDEILSGTSASPDGPFTGTGGAQADIVFGNSANGFDSLHTCDPSVIQVGGTYYLYYTGTSDPAGNNNAIGLATSTDGTHWTRANGGRPVVTASGEVHRANSYGAGQPSALYLNGWFYLMFTDTTGKAAAANGAGQFVLRAENPTFTSGVQALGPEGFAPVSNPASSRQFSVLNGFTSDWMWVDALNAFAIAADNGNGTQITFWDPTFRYHPYLPITIAGAWQEGPGWIRRADGHALVNTADPCGTVALDLVRATQQAGGPTGLAHFGVTVSGVDGCGTTAQALTVLNGFAVPSPERTVDLVVGQKLVEVERRSVAAGLAQAILAEPVPALAGVPVETTIPAGAQAVVAPGRAVGLILTGNKIWVIGSTALAAANSSTVATVSTAQWDGYPRGLDLTDLRP
ncbi:MAG TPA: beta-xylosidase [Pseudonocardiaceae bacterium]|jgi:hypothetical protein|nr:beta-xylosidase [Pseudonocardiaceae bacterium]